MLELNKIYVGNVLDVLKGFPDQSVDCVITSPPYWNARSYQTNPVIWDGDPNCNHVWSSDIKRTGNEYRNNKGGLRHNKIGKFDEISVVNKSTSGNFCEKCGAWLGELGREPFFEMYISHLSNIFQEIYRVLTDIGCVYVNLGDTYISKGATRHLEHHDPKYPEGRKVTEAEPAGMEQTIPSKCLTMIPARFAIEMTSDKWILRQILNWVKNNAMPSSTKSRFTIDFENIFMFVKSNTAKFWVNHKLQHIIDIKPSATNGKENEDWEWRVCPVCNGTGCSKSNCVNGYIKMPLWNGHDYYFITQYEEAKNNEVRIKRTSFNVNTKPLKEKHFAAYPRELIRTPMLASVPEIVCDECGLPFIRIPGTNKYSSCSCNGKTRPGIVLDPFMGSGTTALEALFQNKAYIGIEINDEYAAMCERRISKFKKSLNVLPMGEVKRIQDIWGNIDISGLENIVED